MNYPLGTMNRFKFAFSLLVAAITCVCCQSLSKSSEKAEVPLTSDPWFTTGRTGNWDQIEKLQKELNRPWDFKSSNGMTVFMLAARNGQVEMIQKLISKKIDINLRDDGKFNALSYSIHGPVSQELRQQTCTLLVQNGADAFAEDQMRLTPIQMMIEYGFITCLKQVNLKTQKLCDKVHLLTQIKSLVAYAEKEDEKEIATYLKAQGCE